MATPTPFDEIQREITEFERIIENTLSEQLDYMQILRGELIEARVLDITENEVFFDIGQKQEGVCPLSEFDEKPQIGSYVKVMLVKGRGIEGNSIVSRKEAAIREAWERINEAYRNNLPLSGKIVSELNNNKGYIVDLGGLKLFLPKSHVGLKTKNRMPRLKSGDLIDFKVLKIDENRRSAIISRKKIQEDINHEKWQQFLSTYKEDDIVEGTITKVLSFGLFVRILDLEGLVHIKDISWKNNFPFRKFYSKGDKVSVKILQIVPNENRISLGIKQLTEDPWIWALRELKEEDIISGTVTTIADYGAFVEIREGLEGLIHVSELSWSNKKKHPKHFFKTGDIIEVKIINIDQENKRIGLSYKQAKENPWKKFMELYKVGDVLEGRITSITKFGAFVEILDEVEGLIHFNDYSWDDKSDKKMLKKNDKVKFKVLAIDIENKKISCGIKQLYPSPLELLSTKYKKGDILEGKITGVSDFGLFVDIGEGYEGLVHISKIPLKKGEKLQDKYKVGDVIKTVLLKIEPDKKKISLSIKDFERRKEKDLVNQYLKNDTATYTLGNILKQTIEENKYD